MRAKTGIGRRGFTLVELMIVVAIIGVLAALAIYGVRKYLASAKTSEAKNTIGAICRGATSAFERETTVSQLVGEGTTSSGANNALCFSANSVPSTGAPAGRKYQPKTTDGNDFESGDAVSGWKCLKFGEVQAIYFEYNYTFAASKHGTVAVPAVGFEVAARGDTDNDTQISTFARVGKVNTTTQQLSLSTQIEVINEFE